MSKTPPPSIDLNMRMSPLNLPDEDSDDPYDNFSRKEQCNDDTTTSFLVEDMEEDNKFSINKKLSFSPQVNSSSPTKNKNDFIFTPAMESDGRNNEESLELPLETNERTASSNHNTAPTAISSLQATADMVTMDDHEISKLIRKLEKYRDDLKMLSVSNAEIMDCLIMTGCVDL